MKTVTAGIAGTSAILMLISAAFAADPARGQHLVTAYCGDCHNATIYSGNQRKATDTLALREQILTGALALGLNWTNKEVEDVTEYLNNAYYHFNQ